MGFIIGLCGFACGIGLIALLATIGYYAEKNNPTSNSLNVKDENVNNATDMKSPVDSSVMNFNELPNVDKKLNDVIDGFNDSSNKNVLDDSLSTSEIPEVSVPEAASVDSGLSQVSISEPTNDTSVDHSVSNVTVSESASVDAPVVEENNTQSFSSSNFENVNLSLEDLEKKNYGEIVSNNNTSEDDNYYYSNLDDSVSEIPVDDSSDSVSESEKSVVDSTNIMNSVETPVVSESSNVTSTSEYFSTENVNNDVQSIDNSESVQLNEVSDVVGSNENVSISNPVSETNLEDDSLSDHIFDGEISSVQNSSSDVIPESNSLVEEQQVTENINEQSSENEVPEISGDGFSILNDDSTDDDIWKF